MAANCLEKSSVFSICLTVPRTLHHQRLDRVLSNLLPEYSRAHIQRWIKGGYVKIEKLTPSQNHRVAAEQIIEIHAPTENQTTATAQAMDLDIIYEDRDIIILNKPMGLVTHPGAGNPNGTLLNALLYHYPELSLVPRAGIVHRLDKNTTGIMIVSRNLTSHYKLTSMLQERKIKREYLAIVHGKMIAGGTINTNLGRSGQRRTLMAVREHGKVAITHYRIIDRFALHTYLRVSLETGRTHQIRVHLAHLGFPIVGDRDYSNISKISYRVSTTLRQALENFNRQALHATKLELSHPTTGVLSSWEVDPPEDFRQLLLCLNEDATSS